MLDGQLKQAQQIRRGSLGLGWGRLGYFDLLLLLFLLGAGLHNKLDAESGAVRDNTGVEGLFAVNRRGNIGGFLKNFKLAFGDAGEILVIVFVLFLVADVRLLSESGGTFLRSLMPWEYIGLGTGCRLLFLRLPSFDMLQIILPQSANRPFIIL